MSPLLRYLHLTFPELSLPQTEQEFLHWDFAEQNRHLTPEFYRKLLSLHLVMDLEYNLLRQQLHVQFLPSEPINLQECIDQLVTALTQAELLEKIYKFYLRDFETLRDSQALSDLGEHKKIYRELLAFLRPNLSKDTQEIPQNSPLAQEIRNKTATLNMYRVLLLRSKRVLDLLLLLKTNSENTLPINTLINSILAQAAWMIFVPRLAVNLIILLKHTIPGWWMKNDEYSLGWYWRFSAQLQRNGLPIAIDTVWHVGGLINCFYLIGPLAALRIYVTLGCFACDILAAMARKSIELNRLYAQQSFYTDLLKKPCSENEKYQILNHLKTLDQQISFEQFRLNSLKQMSILVFLASCCALPILAANPFFPLLGALSLVTLSLNNFDLLKKINLFRPKATIELKPALTKLGFFVQKNVNPDSFPTKDLDMVTVPDPS
jgi:hypothetical protein